MKIPFKQMKISIQISVSVTYMNLKNKINNNNNSNYVYNNNNNITRCVQLIIKYDNRLCIRKRTNMLGLLVADIKKKSHRQQRLKKVYKVSNVGSPAIIQKFSMLSCQPLSRFPAAERPYL